MTNNMEKLVNSLKVQGIVNCSRVESALLSVDRSHYCPSQDPFQDCPYPIGYNATISAPHMHAHALENLKDKLVSGARVLDVGSGSGYLASCMAHMVAPDGVVYGVDHIKELIVQSKESIRRDCPKLLDSGRVQLFESDGRDGLPQFAPYDVIHVGATAPELPVKLIEQLKEGGTMVLPIQRDEHQVFEKLDKLPGGSLKFKQILRVRYVPLTDVKSQLRAT